MEEKCKLFISYSHDDEEAKNKFTTFLATLKRNGIITEWNDRQLLAGDKLNDEIINNIQNSDIICLLISQSFLASYYCVEEELARALSQVENGVSRIFPIIVDHSTWLDTELKDYTAVPNDGTPIADYDNPNKAWLEVIEHLKKAINKNNKIKKKHR
ncbi:TPA: toll/interleukin-1 receptor domain-containing protein [Vibrio harveyi]|uniref:toll/interleukin-1 receptor domain-containing protein n=1 Tax=Vibrio harveyi TaxID=669 RepID=UPI00390BC477